MTDEEKAAPFDWGVFCQRVAELHGAPAAQTLDNAVAELRARVPEAPLPVAAIVQDVVQAVWKHRGRHLEITFATPDEVDWFYSDGIGRAADHGPFETQHDALVGSLAQLYPTSAPPPPPRVALTSYARSGNTWLRSLLEAVTGEATGSVYGDPIMRRGKTGVVIKTHGQTSWEFDRAVHLVRNPFDALESYFAYRVHFVGEQVSWERHMAEQIVSWRRHTDHWLAVEYPACRLRYEDLQSDPIAELGRVTRFLGFDIDDDTLGHAFETCSLAALRARHVEEHPKSHVFFRRGTTGDGLASFTRQQRRLANYAWAPLLKRFGYQEAPE